MATVLTNLTATDPPAAAGVIRVRGARTHNLRDVDLDIPRGRLVVLTGKSGSGKSSLAFNTLHAEGQRQYIESLSVYARQFLHQLQRPDVDAVGGLQPTLCIDQQAGQHSPRSTVGTITEIYDYLRLFMARLGQPSCIECGTVICQQAPERIQQRVMQLPEGTRVMVMAPLVREQRGAHEESIQQIRQAGLVRARVDGLVYDLDQIPPLAPRKTHDIDAVMDRIVVRDGGGTRVAEAIQAASQWGDERNASGAVAIAYALPADGSAAAVWQDEIYSTRPTCPRCHAQYAELEPRSFSFNSAYGACPTCEGLGRPPDDETGLVCSACAGTRLRPESRSVRLGGRAVHEITAQPIHELPPFFQSLVFEDWQQPVAAPLIRDICHRLQFLLQVGVGYLTLDRAADTLSGGELQRVRLATSIGSGLVGVCYILDEPSIGLHPRDNETLIAALRRLQQQGNSVLVVEHDDAIMRCADWLIDMGPGAGAQGGLVVAQGTPAALQANAESLTGQYLSGRCQISVPTQRRETTKVRALRLEGVTTHNLQEVSVVIPLDVLVAVTGVSGSGKSSLIHETLIPGLRRRLGAEDARSGPHRSLRGVSMLDRVVWIDQSPVGRSPRSNAATYSGLFDEIRKIFAATRSAKQRGYGVGRFSFNNKEGRCEACQGQGSQKVAMGFLPDLYVTCEACQGAQFNRQTLQVRYRDRTIAEVLAMRVDDALEFLENFPPAERMLACFQQIGLGYLPLGQSATTLSGGEAQRVRLATELGRADTGHTLYVLDEPTTGLHVDDVRRLLDVLQGLVDKGNSVLVIEHHLDVIKCADWVIDLGPEGGAGGGRIVAEGTPEAIARCPESHTGRYLSPLLTGCRRSPAVGEADS